MRSILVVLVVASSAHADSSVTITNDSLWPSHAKPVSVRVAGGGWQTVKTGTTTKPLALKAPKGGKVIPIDVKAPSGGKSFRRWAVIVPDTKYKIVGNPCGMYGFTLDGNAPPDPDNDGIERVKIDLTAINPKHFPIVISTDSTDDNDELTGITLEKPGISEPIELLVSAMCPRSGAGIVIYSKPTKKRLLDASLIAHPDAMHMLVLARPGTFTVTVN